ncbi:MAG TPA: hypothetical protein DCY41_04140 [Opitutae bacterium]|nr:hypothetical protein [Opitutae bacterium]
MRVFALLFLTTCAVAGPDTLRIEIQPLPSSVRPLLEQGKAGQYVFSYPDYYTWCPSIIRDEKGRYQLFHSRWPKAKAWTSWLTHSEIDRAVATSPEGPYTPIGVVIPATSEGRGKWFDAHNPKIEKFEGSYWLYFIQTWGTDITESMRTEIARKAYSHPKWSGELRPNQRTFVANATSLDGPWSITPDPIVEPARTIVRLTVNPAVCRRPDGSYLMIVKGDKPGERKFIRNQAVATSPKPQGPWTITDKPAIDYMDTEDVSLWYDQVRGRYYAVFHETTNSRGFIGMITSEDGLNWGKSAQFELTPKVVHLDDGTIWKPDMMERPYMLCDEKGNPTHLIVACSITTHSSIVILPVKVK